MATEQQKTAYTAAEVATVSVGRESPFRAGKKSPIVVK